jgi:hypothetical protein
VPASSLPTFALDSAASSITISHGGVCASLTCATLEGDFAAGADKFSWNPSDPADTTTQWDFFDWTVTGGGLQSFSISVDLVFSSPDVAFGTGTGSGQVGGNFVGGQLAWDAPVEISFAQGSTLFVNLHDMDGTSDAGSSGADFYGEFVAVVPLPASVPLLVAGLGALGWVGRRKKRT